MAEIIKKITVDVMGENLFESIVAKQNDYNSRFLNVTFVSENDIIEIDPSSTVLINALRADSEAKSFAGTVNEDGTVTVPLTSWMLELDDVVKCDISIIDDSSRKLTSTLFTVTVEEAANGNGDDISEDENYDVLLTLIAECKAATEEAQKVTEKQSELQTDINNLRAEVNVMSGDLGDWIGSDTVYQAVTKLKAKDTDLQSQIDNLGGVDLSELQSQIDTKIEQVNGRTGKSIAITANDIASVGSNANLAMDVSLLGGEVDKINAHLGEQTSSKTIHELIDTKVTKVDGKGLSTNDYDDTAKKKVTKIGDTDLIPSDSRYIVQWIQDVYDSVFTSTADNTCLADRVTDEVASRKSADENLQSQIDALGGVDVSELQTDINHLQEKVNVMYGDIGDWIGSDTVYQAVTKLKAKDTDLQSQIDNLGGVDLSELQTDINHLQEKVNVMYGDIGDWIGSDTVYQAVTKLKAKDTDLQSQIDTKAIREVAIVGSDNENSAGWYKVADGTMPALNDVSMLFAVHSTVTNKQYAGILQLNLRSATSNITCPQFGWLLRNGFEDGQVIVTTDGLNWAMYFKVTTPRYYRTFFEVLQKSDRINSALKNYNLYTNSTVETTAPTATFASTDLGSVHQAIADLTARIEALEENSSGGVSQAVLIDWDVNTNGTTQGTVTKDANGLHASGSTSIRIANYWRNDASAYDGITFTAYGSGKLRVEVGGVEGEYKTLGTTPTTYTVAFADIGLTELSGIEINLQTQGAYDLTVSDIYGYTNL